MVIRTEFAVSTCALVLLGAACGGSTSSGPSNTDAGVTRADGGSFDGSPGKLVACPEAEPAPGTTCEHADLQCEFGTDPRRECHSLATCTQGTWQLVSPKCSPIPAVTCPASRAAAHGNACTPEGGLCVYEEGLTCSCTRCPNPYPICKELATPVWECQAPNADAECPPARPNLGAACSQDQKKCSYGCEPENNLVCSGAMWRRDPNNNFGCPVSTRRVKKDIHYLSSVEKAALAHEVERIKLATYEYTDPALAGERRLGFIIEDRATTYAADAERSQIDLYAYTSTLVAALQEQGKRIESLEREVTSLRRAKAR